MLIDFHTHCFPESIAPKALDKLSDASCGLRYYTDGTVNGLGASMADSGVDLSVVLNIATNPRQQKSVNDFAASINGKNGLVAFGSVFPGSEDAFEELERIKHLGLKGVKLHPDYQGFQADDPRWKPLYGKISSLGLITVFHAGVDYGFPPPYGGTPRRLATALSWFDSPVIAAHWGGLDCYDDVLRYLCGTDIYFDTAFGYAHIPRYYAETMIERHGTDRILFGTDTPWHTPAMEQRMLSCLKLTDGEREQINAGNAKSLLQLD